MVKIVKNSHEGVKNVVAALSIASIADAEHDQVRQLLSTARIANSPIGKELHKNEKIIEALCVQNFLLKRELSKLRSETCYGVNRNGT